MRHPWIAAGAVAAVMITVMFQIWPHSPSDLEVYRITARTALHQGQRPGLYAVTNPPGLPFTYPPFAVLPMLPLAYGRFIVDVYVVRVLLAFALAALWYASLRAAGARVSWPLLTLLTVASIALEPVMWDLQSDQISMIVVLLVVVDLPGATSWRYRGALTGVAAALKLTPLVFVVFLALTRQWRALGLMLGGFAAATVLGFAIFPRASWAYWTRYVHQTDRVGVAWRVGDQSVRGALTRIGLDQGAVADRALLLAGVVVTAGAALVLGALWWRAGERLLGVSLTGLASLLASPISWPHHWVWLVPLLVALARMSYAVAVLAVVPYCITLRIGHHRWGDVLYHWGAAQNLFGNAYVWTALLLVAYAGWRLVRDRRGIPGQRGYAPARPTTLAS